MFRRPFGFGGPFGYGRGTYGMWGRRRYGRRGCGCGGLGASVLLSVVATYLANLFLRRRY